MITLESNENVSYQEEKRRLSAFWTGSFAEAVRIVPAPPEVTVGTFENGIEFPLRRGCTRGAS